MNRTASIPIRSVEPGMKLVDIDESGEHPAVLRSFEFGDFFWRVTWDGGSVKLLPDEHVRVEDPSGVINLKYEVEEYGPYFTTSNIVPENQGHVHIANSRWSGTVLLVDLIVHYKSEDGLEDCEVRLDRVELRNIESVVNNAKATAFAETPDEKAEGGVERDWCEACKDSPAGQRWLCPNYPHEVA